MNHRPSGAFFICPTRGIFEFTYTSDIANMNSTPSPLSGHEIIEDALKKANLGDPNNSPFPMSHGVATAYQMGLAAAYQHALEMIPEVVNMILHCPQCGAQHIDEPHGEWKNPPHRSHLCMNPTCNHIWRPADVCTNGVSRVMTRGEADSPKAYPATSADKVDARRWRGFLRALSRGLSGAGFGRKIKVVEVDAMFGEPADVKDIQQEIDTDLRARGGKG